MTASNTDIESGETPKATKPRSAGAKPRSAGAKPRSAGTKASGAKPRTASARKPAAKRAPAKRAPAKRAPTKRAASATSAAKRNANPAAKPRKTAERSSAKAEVSTEVEAKLADGLKLENEFEQAWEQAVAAAALRREKNPDVEVTDLYMQLLRDKCLRAGTLGAATSVAAMIPGLGTIARFAIDGIGDAAYTAKLQQELALTTFALYGRKPNEKERLRIIGWIATFGAGGSELIEQAGKMIARQLAKNFAGRLLRRGLPFAEVAYSTATHLAGTYFVGRRAQLYCIGLSDAESEILLESEKGVKLQVRRMKKLAEESVEAMEERFGHPGRTLGILFRRLTGTDKD